MAASILNRRDVGCPRKLRKRGLKKCKRRLVTSMAPCGSFPMLIWYYFWFIHASDPWIFITSLLSISRLLTSLLGCVRKNPADLWFTHSLLVHPKPHRKDSPAWDVIRKITNDGRSLGLKDFRPIKPLGSGDTGRYFGCAVIFSIVQYFSMLFGFGCWSLVWF